MFIRVCGFTADVVPANEQYFYHFLKILTFSVFSRVTDIFPYGMKPQSSSVNLRIMLLATSELFSSASSSEKLRLFSKI